MVSGKLAKRAASSVNRPTRAALVFG